MSSSGPGGGDERMLFISTACCQGGDRGAGSVVAPGEGRLLPPAVSEDCAAPVSLCCLGETVEEERLGAKKSQTGAHWQTDVMDGPTAAEATEAIERRHIIRQQGPEVGLSCAAGTCSLKSSRLRTCLIVLRVFGQKEHSPPPPYRVLPSSRIRVPGR
ncbi:hypothetical protein INR49_007002 [Caranx melampygus]|nr:hypothetical protein INR49_007002 [Caranx melampygus]